MATRHAVLLAVGCVQFCKGDGLAGQFMNILGEFLALALQPDVNQLAATALVGFGKIDVEHNILFLISN